MAALRKSDTPSVGELTYYEARKQQRLLPQRECNSCVYYERWLWSYFVNLEAANVVGLCLASVLTLTSYEDECFHFSLCTILKCFVSTLHSSFDIFRNTNIALFTKCVWNFLRHFLRLETNKMSADTISSLILEQDMFR